MFTEKRKATFDVEVKIPPGFGARHLAAAAVTKRTAATAMVVSSTDGHVRAFSGGTMVLQLDPNVPYDFYRWRPIILLNFVCGNISKPVTAAKKVNP
jgi:hypothetical protein